MSRAKAFDRLQGRVVGKTLATMQSPSERRKTTRRKASQAQSSVKLRLGNGSEERQAQVVDISASGLGLEVAAALTVGAIVHVTGHVSAGLSQFRASARPAIVAYCHQLALGRYSVGVAFTDCSENAHSGPQSPGEAFVDYYELLQLSPKADTDTIHRVYRLLAQRYHPDNRDTGDAALFRDLLEAYRVLSDPEKRAAYDVRLVQARQLRWKIFDQSASAHNKETEQRKRAGILSLLYTQRLNQPQQPGMSIHDLEDLLGCPREHLEFSLWYLRETGNLTRTDNGRYAITVKGVDKAETEDILPKHQLLTAAS